MLIHENKWKGKQEGITLVFSSVPVGDRFCINGCGERLSSQWLLRLLELSSSIRVVVARFPGLDLASDFPMAVKHPIGYSRTQGRLRLRE